MNLYLATITGKDDVSGKHVAITGIKLWAASKNDVWKELIANALEDEVIGDLKDALETAKASELTEKDVQDFVLAVEENADMDIFVWDLGISSGQVETCPVEACNNCRSKDKCGGA